MLMRARRQRGGRRHETRLLLLSIALLLAVLAGCTAVVAPSAAATLELTADSSTTNIVGPAPSATGGHGTGLRPGPVDFSELQGVQVSPQMLTYAPSFDLRSLGRLTPVRDQGIYGTCWAFAAYGSLESSLLPGETWDFSEDNMVYFHGFDWDGYDGGNFEMATAYLVRWGGPFTEAQDAYADGVHPDPSSLTLQKHVQSVVMMPPRADSTANDDLKYALTTYGAVGTSMYWMSGALDTETGGYYYSGTATANHGVTLVGWDDSYSRTNFATQPPGDGAFIVRNSWGSTWGTTTGGTWGGDGYFYVSYYDAEFAYATSAVFTEAEPTDNYARVYQYDPLGYVSSLGFQDNPTAWFANRFTAAADEPLAAVGFYTPAPDATYEVYAGATLATKQLKASGTLSDFGYHTVQLDTPMDLTDGQSFAVAVKLTVPSFDGSWVAPIVVEIPVQKYSSKASAAAGQSYYSSNGSTWTDFTTFDPKGNVCLKAYTQGTGPMAPTVTAPNGGESWSLGSPQTITWTGGGDGTATIELSLDGGATYPVTIAADTTNDGSQPWVVDSDSTSLAKVRVTTATGADESDAVFAISGSPVEQGGWLAQLTGTALPLWDIAGWGEDRAYAAGDDGTIVGTVDAGDHWSAQPTPVTNDLRGVDFLDDAFGYAVGGSGRMLRTSNAGASWVKLASGASRVLNGIDVIDATRAAAAGREGIFRTSDGGATWRHQTSGLADVIWLRDVDFISPLRGWTVGYGGQIFSTTNAGGSWRQRTSGTSEHLEAVTFLTSKWGWAVGRNGVVLQTVDGGANWLSVGVPTDEDLWDVEFVGAELGWIVGDGGTVLKTVDGGVTWVAQDLGWAPTLRGVTMQSEGYGWAAGFDGTTLRFWPGSGGDDLLPPHTTATAVLDRWYNVAVPITLDATDPSGVARSEYRMDDGDWQTGGEVVTEAPLDGANDGYHRVDYRSVDTLDNTESFHSIEVRLDTQRPVTAAPYKERVARYNYVKLTYKVKDAAPNAGKAKVTIKIKTLGGKVVKKLLVGTKKVNVLLAYRWRCTLAKGTYRFYVYATDLAGNTQSYVGRNKLVVY